MLVTLAVLSIWSSAGRSIAQVGSACGYTASTLWLGLTENSTVAGLSMSRHGYVGTVSSRIRSRNLVPGVGGLTRSSSVIGRQPGNWYGQAVSSTAAPGHRSRPLRASQGMVSTWVSVPSAEVHVTVMSPGVTLSVACTSKYSHGTSATHRT